MLRIVIIGGKLQGSEVAYLGKKAGYEVVLVDKNPYAPARELCSRFICADITEPDQGVLDLLRKADIIIPTMESYEVLEFMTELCDKMELPLAFDWNAYKITCSKITSNRLFIANDLPVPEYYPEGNYPYIAKPSGDSGSSGVVFIENESEFREFEARNKNNYIIQEYIEGPSYSVEVIGTPGNYRTYVLTEILTDEGYDCNQVLILRDIDSEIVNRINGLAIEIAELIGLKGIMDLEVIANNKDVRILEIDARFPSQTPIAVYYASGMNYVKELCDLFIHGDFKEPVTDRGHYASLIHYYIENGTYISKGEHIMVEGDALNYTDGICTEASIVSDYAKGKNVWRGMFINHAESREKLGAGLQTVRNEIVNVAGVRKK